jgi:alpha-glucosidase
MKESTMPTLWNNLLETLKCLSPEASQCAATYAYRKAAAEAAWTPEGRRRWGAARLPALVRSLDLGHQLRARNWVSPGPVDYIRPHERGAILECRHGVVDITFLSSDLVRVRVRPSMQGPPREPIPYALAKPLDDWPVPELTPVENSDAFVIGSQDLLVGAQLDSARVFIGNQTGTLLRADVSAAWGENGALRHRVALAPEERIFGLGERATPGNRRGRTHVLWNSDPAGYENDDDPINLNVPVYLGVVPAGKDAGADAPSASYLVFYENPYYAEFDLGQTDPKIGEHRFADGELRYYLMAGPLPSLIERYTELTGRHSLQPLWMLGYQQSRWSYDSAERVRKLARDFEENQVPCDVIHLDIDYMDGFRCFTHDSERFPDLAGLARELREQGIKLISIIDPGIKQDPNYRIYREGVRGDHFVTTPDGRLFHAPVWPGDSAFPDFTDPKTRAWWGPLYKSLIHEGIAGFWNDMNEPAAFAITGDRTLPSIVTHALEGQGGNHREAHNLYGMLMARASREGLEALRPEKRPVVFTRAGWAGVQRYATSWTGDNESTWESLALTIPMVIGLGLSGIGFTGPDIGGFIGTPTGELFTRWIQMGAFIPFFRAHTCRGYPDQEPWSYGEPYLSIVRRFIELRYELLPYLYTAVWQMCTRGWPVVRPLAWGDADDPALWDIEDAFLCGDALLVAPVLAAGAGRRKVALPGGVWYDFWTNQAFTGGQTIAQHTPLETLPLLVREGQILTLGEVGRSVEQRKDKFLRLGLYALRQPGEAVTELYEDAGEGLDYQAGVSRLSHLTMRRTEDTLEVIWDKSGAFKPPYEHIELTINGLERVPEAIIADGERYAVLQTDPLRRWALAAVPPFQRLEIAL